MKLKRLLELSKSDIKYWALFADIYEKNFKGLTSSKEIDSKFNELINTISSEQKNALIYFYMYAKLQLNETLIKEGKYDKISGIILKEIMDFLNKSKKIYDKKPEKKYLQKLIKQYSFPLDFIFKLLIGRANDIEAPELEAEILTKNDNRVYLNLTIFINPKDEPQKYNWISGKIKSLIRHEIEHGTQEGPNRISDRPFMTDEEQELYKKALNSGDFVSYFTHKLELPAYVNQMYIVAKFYKVPIDVAIDDFLGEAVKAKYISEKEKDFITSKWEAYIKHNLPNSKFLK